MDIMYLLSHAAVAWIVILSLSAVLFTVCLPVLAVSWLLKAPRA